MDFYGNFPYSGIHNATILPGTERGVAPGAYLYNAKAFDEGGSGYWSWIIEAIEWSVAHGADVISGSFGGWPEVPADQDPVVLALKEAIKHGVVAVIAAGNEGFGYFSTGTPGFAPDVITVGATTETDYLIYFSSRGPEQFELHAKPDIVAPGVSVVAAFSFFKEVEEFYGWQLFYMEISGTSMATPHVSGAAALLLQAFPGATPYTIKAAMMQGADDLGLDPMAQGAGRLNVKKAYDIMNAAPKTQWTAPLPTDTVEPNPPVLMAGLNLTDKTILIENSFSHSSLFSQFTSLLGSYGASISYGAGIYTNNMLVNPGTLQPNYDVFIIPKPYMVSTILLPPSVLDYYVQHNGTVLFIGDSPIYTDQNYDDWTEIWGITWNNTAVGGLSTHIDPHNITSGITELYFGNPIASLIVNTGMQATTVVWDPIFPGIAVWQTPAPAKGKVVVISDDGLLSDQFLHTADNLQLGLNIIKWFTATSEIKFQLIELVFGSSISVESPHPYPANASVAYAVYQPGASWIAVHFDTIEVEASYDYVYILDMNWNMITYFTGNYYDVWTPPISGDTVYILLISDDIFQWWGFLADLYVYGYPASIPTPPDYHEIGIGGTWPKYVIANTTATISVNVTNFGTYTENVTLYMNGINVKNVTNLAPSTSTIADVSITPNATLICDESGVNMTSLNIWGSIIDPEIDYTNNAFFAEIAAVPKGKRTGANPLLSVMAPMKIESTTAPLITMYPEDFTLHNITAFVGGGQLVNAEFQITGNVSQIADFVDVTSFTYHTMYSGLPDPSPAYFIPNMTAIVGDTLVLDDALAPAMLFAELQVHITDDMAAGTYIGQIELVNGTTTIASTSLSFEVKKPKYRVLWEDYYNDYEGSWYDCERLWGGAVWGYGVSEWWKLVSEAGFDVDSLHQQLYLKQHIGVFGNSSVDPLEIIAFGGYKALYLHDDDFYFSRDQISVFRQLYETGKMDFVVVFDSGSEALSSLTGYYGISASSSGIFDLVITGIDKTHPIFANVENFTTFGGPLLTIEPPVDAESVTSGIATGTDDSYSVVNGFVVAVNEMHATSHLTTRMIAMSDSTTFEFLEYSKFMVWYYTWYYTGKGIVASRVDTDKVAVNMLEWLDPQFANEPPVIDYFDITPTTAKLGETVSIDVVVHDPEDDTFTVMIAIQKPDNSWSNTTVSSVGGHWLRSFTADLEGRYDIYVIATDSYAATTSMLIGIVNAVNMPPEIVSSSISPTQVAQGETVFITLNTKDAEDRVPESIKVSVISPTGPSYDYNFANMGFATLTFDTSGKPAGIYTVSVLIEDLNGAQTTATIGYFEVTNTPPKIVSYSISPSTVTLGEAVFITANGEDVEDAVLANITLSVIDPDGTKSDYNFLNTVSASIAFNTTGKPTGIYQVQVQMKDAGGATTTVNIGLFKVNPVPVTFPIREATFGVSVIGLVALIFILLLIFQRFPGKSPTA
jgi:hypothetical protein